MNIQITCPSCGSQLTVDSEKEFFFCSNCGTRIAKAPQPQQITPNQNKPPINNSQFQPQPVPQQRAKRPWYKKWWIWVIAGVVLTAIIGAVFGQHDNGSKDFNDFKQIEATGGQKSEEYSLTDLFEDESTTQKETEKSTEKPTEKPTEKLTEKVTEKPTEKPTEASIPIIINYPEKINAGETATVWINAAPNTKYTIDVEYKSGKSKAEGLYPKTTDSNGYAEWSWEVGAGTTEGNIVVTISGGGSSQSVNIYVD